MALADLADRREQDLLDAALHRAQGEGGLHGGVGAIELEGLSAPMSVLVSELSDSRAREMADEIDSPSWSASRSAATSPCV